MSRTRNHRGKRFGGVKRAVKDRGKERIRTSDRRNIKNLMMGYDPDVVVWMGSGRYSVDWWWYD